MKTQEISVIGYSLILKAIFKVAAHPVSESLLAKKNQQKSKVRQAPNNSFKADAFGAALIPTLGFMSMNQEYQQQLEFLRSVYTATANGRLSWSILESSESEIFRSSLDGKSLDFEFLYFQPSGIEGTVRAAALVSVLKTYFHVFAGTEGFSIIMSTLALQIPGWAEGASASLGALEKAIKAVQG